MDVLAVYKMNYRLLLYCSFYFFDCLKSRFIKCITMQDFTPSDPHVAWRETISPPLAFTSLLVCIIAQVLFCIFCFSFLFFPAFLFKFDFNKTRFLDSERFHVLYCRGSSMCPTLYLFCFLRV
jgi:hypothetical protein